MQASKNHQKTRRNAIIMDKNPNIGVPLGVMIKRKRNIAN